MLFRMIRGDRWKIAGACLVAAIMFCASAPRAMAQAVAIAEVDGHVTDPSGQAIVGATVKMTSLDKHQSRTTNTDATGRYALPNLPVGPYRLEVSSPGFKTYVQLGIELQVASNVDIPVTMTIGAVTESVQVTANAAMVETKDSAISQVIGERSIDDLPLNGRNPTQLLTLNAAVISNADAGGSSNATLNGGDLTGSKNIQGSNGSGSFSVAGGQQNGINFLLDGGDNNDSFSNVNLPIPFPDAIQEFNVQTSGLPAQYGLHPGGVVNIVTKSGANALHGDLFEFIRNGDLNARPKGDAYGTQPIRDSLKRSQFGGTVGGRILKDKLFFFAGYQGTRQRSNPSTNTSYVPTAATLAGDFSLMESPKSTGGCQSAQKTLKNVSGTPYPNNQIPVASFDPAGIKLASTYVPTSTDPCGTYRWGYITNNPDDQWIGRVDWVVSDHQNFYGRYYLYDFTALALYDGHNGLTTGQSGNQDRAETMTIGDNYTFAGGSKVNSFHATYNRRRDNRAAPLNMFSPKDLGINMFINIGDYTQFTLSGYSGGGFAFGCGTCALANFDVNNYQLADDFTWIKGKHQFQFGFDGRKQQFNSFNYQQANGQFTVNGTTTGDGLADLLIGRFSGLTDGNVISDYMRQTAGAAYAQDSIHVAHNFSVNLGLRWEPSVPSYDKQSRGNQFNMALFQQNWHTADPRYTNAPPGLVFATDKAQNPYGNKFTKAHYGTMSPRLGMVWDPKGDGKQTLRGAFVLIHDTTELFYPERWTTNAPYVSSVTINSGEYSLNSGPLSQPFLGYPGGDPFPGNVVFAAAGQYISVPQNMQVQYMMQWNLSYQRQLAADWLVTANYMGNATRHIWGSIDVNYSNPTIPGATAANANSRRLTYLANPTGGGQYYGEIQQTDDGGNAEYNGLLLSAQHRLSHGMSVTANYNWSHCSSSWDFAGELAGTVYQNPNNRKTGERGNCGFDHRQNFVAQIVAISPGVGQTAAKFVTKDWQLSPILNFMTGNPLQLTDGGKDISLSAQLLDRPEVMLPTQVYGPKALGGYLNGGAFGCAGNVASNQSGSCTVFSGQFGNLGRNSIYGPGVISWDMAISRNFKLSERFKLDFRSDVFNIMNHANWGNPVTNITSSTFGDVTGFRSPRIIQMSLKLFF